MINFLRGKVKFIDTNLITLDVNNVGYEVTMANAQAYTLNQELEVLVYYHFNQENGPTLYGFESQLAKKIFSLIISISGFGPKIGLAILAQMTPEQFLQAITLADYSLLNSINGIGAKKAEMMVMQLKDKVSKISKDSFTSFESIEGATLTKIKEISDVLTSLNYSKNEINSALDFVKKNNTIETTSFDELLRKSLTHLAKRV